jgi:hypothetical protein
MWFGRNDSNDFVLISSSTWCLNTSLSQQGSSKQEQQTCVRGWPSICDFRRLLQQAGQSQYKVKYIQGRIRSFVFAAFYVLHKTLSRISDQRFGSFRHFASAEETRLLTSGLKFSRDLSACGTAKLLRLPRQWCERWRARWADHAHLLRSLAVCDYYLQGVKARVTAWRRIRVSVANVTTRPLWGVASCILVGRRGVRNTGGGGRWPRAAQRARWPVFTISSTCLAGQSGLVEPSEASCCASFKTRSHVLRRREKRLREKEREEQIVDLHSLNHAILRAIFFFQERTWNFARR